MHQVTFKTFCVYHRVGQIMVSGMILDIMECRIQKWYENLRSCSQSKRNSHIPVQFPVSAKRCQRTGCLSQWNLIIGMIKVQCSNILGLTKPNRIPNISLLTGQINLSLLIEYPIVDHRPEIIRRLRKQEDGVENLETELTIMAVFNSSHLCLHEPIQW
jgi:hypothetical protein